MDFTGGITISGGLTITPTTAVAANDPYFMYNSLLLPGNGTNLAQNNTFLDGSTNNFTITRAGNTTQGTFSPYGSNWSNYFDGTGDYLTAPNNAAFSLGSGNLSIELFVYISSYTASSLVVLFSNYQDASNGWTIGIRAETSNFYGSINGNISILDNTNTLTRNTWNHIVLCRTGSTTSLFVNGSRVATETNTTNVSSTSTVNIGSAVGGSYNFNGYISNARVIKGSNPYDATQTTLTVPTSPLTAISGTSLLTCQSNRLIDNSTNAFAITKAGDTSVQRFSPFEPTAEYSSSTIGGSGYFDGTGDYLTIAGTSTACALPGDFTIECWYYQNTSSALFYSSIFSTTTAYATTNSLRISTGPNNNTFNVASGPNGTFNSSTTFQPFTWVHIALVRSGTTLTLYQNGVSVGSVTNSQSFVSDTFIIGDVQGVGAPYYLNGYISNFRVVKGTAVYTSAFTPPTAPLTAIANTSLLLNYTNAGIIDNAMMNNLETVGNAQISTTQSKFGGSSMYFDGTTDALFQPSNINYGYSTGDFTIEFWLYLNTTALQTIFSNLTASSGASVAPHIYYANASGIRYYVNSADRITGSALSTGIWYHIAVCRSGSSTKMFINGTQTGSTYTDTNNYGISNPLGVGDYAVPLTGASTLNGYIDDLRITKGYARYTSNFTAPTSAFPLY